MSEYSVVIHDKHGRTLHTMLGSSNLMFATLVREEILPRILGWADKAAAAGDWDTVSIVVKK